MKEYDIIYFIIFTTVAPHGDSFTNYKRFPSEKTTVETDMQVFTKIYQKIPETIYRTQL
jgi:hypothetical protein